MRRDLREQLSALESALHARLERGDDGLSLGRSRARRVDRLLRDHFDRVCPADSLMAMAAVGSHGRGALALHSDIDIRFLGPAGAIAAAVDAIMYPLWDAGMTVGHQIISANDAVALAREDLTTATALLDLRHIAGPSAPLRHMTTLARKQLFGAKRAREFVQRLEAEAAARHDRFGGSVYLLEPDVKLGEGGLRDLDVLHWSSLALGLDGLDAREKRALGHAESFLWRVRNRLHAARGRRVDRLTFDAQEVVACAMGYGLAVSDEALAEAAERMMQDYYQHARTVARLTTRAFERAKMPKKQGSQRLVARGVVLSGKEVTLARGMQLGLDPALALRVLATAVRESLPVSSNAREALTRAAQEPSFASRLRDDREARETFVGLVCASGEVPLAKGSPIRELWDTGLLHAMIPEFSPVMGRVHHDVYHVYTVDVHSVAAVDCLRALVRGDLRSEHPLASRVAAEIARRTPLFFATLIHDMGKGYPDASGSRKHHSQRGAELCDVVLPRLGLSEDDVADARSLVLHHLAMYHLATRRDLADPATTDELARIVRGREGLRDLYLLTIADITTTAPNAMTSWKAHVLQELYLRTDARLAGMPEIDDERMAKLGKAAAEGWDGDLAELDAFIASMPMRWRLAATPHAIRVHARTALSAGLSPRVAVASSGGSDHLDLCVVAPDRHGLLARIAAALTANRLEVLAAQVYSRKSREGMQAVDVFSVRYKDTAADAHTVLSRLERDLADLCDERVTPRDLILARTGSVSPWRERPTPAVPVEIAFDEHASPHATVVEVFAKDQPGLLFRLAQALSDLGLSIVLSKINTEGTKVADVFYVHESNGGKVSGIARFDEIRSRLREAVS